jgi:hypothetical protein
VMNVTGPAMWRGSRVCPAGPERSSDTGPPSGSTVITKRQKRQQPRSASTTSAFLEEAGLGDDATEAQVDVRIISAVIRATKPPRPPLAVAVGRRAARESLRVRAIADTVSASDS